MRLNLVPDDHQLKQNLKNDDLKIKVSILFLLFFTVIVVYVIIFNNYVNLQNYSNIHVYVDKEIVTEQNSNDDKADIFKIQTRENIKRILIDTQIKTWTANDQTTPKVSTLSDGNFVVVWQSYLQDSSGWGIYGQMFYSNGAKKGNEFHVSNSTAWNQTNPNVAAASSGKFMVI